MLASPVFDNWRTKGGIAPTRVIPASTEAFDAYRRHHGGSPQQFKQPRVLRRSDARALLAGEASTAPPAEAEPGSLRAVAEFARRHGVAAAVAPPRETPPPAAPETPPRRAWWRRW